MIPYDKKYFPQTILLLGVIGFAIYSNVLHGEFISDDYVTIVNNDATHHLENVRQMWQMFNTRFLTGFSFAVNYQWGGLNPFGYHLVNIFIHIFNAWLVFCLGALTLETPVMRKYAKGNLLAPIPIYAALIYLCHPLQTQAVAYITQRAVSLATFFYLATLILYIKGRVEGNRKYFFLSWATMLAGVFTKEMIMTVPVSMMMYEIFFFGYTPRFFKSDFKRILPYFLIALLVPLVLLADHHGSVLKLKDQAAQSSFSWPYFLTEINIVREYLRLMVLPINQNHDYDFSLVKNILQNGTPLSFAVIFAVIGIAVAQFSKNRWVSFWIFWFFITISVEFWVQVLVKRGAMYEHWLYLPMVGFSLLSAYALVALFQKNFVRQTVFFCVLMILCTMTYTRNLVWQNEIVFWEDVLRKSPQKPTAYLGAGVAYQRKGYFDLALAKYSRGVELFHQRRPKFVQELDRVYLARVYNNMGQIYFSREQDEQALEYWTKSVETYPSMAENYSNLGFFYFIKYDYLRALEFYNRSLENPGNHKNACVYRRLVLQELREKDDTDAKFPECSNNKNQREMVKR